MAVETIYSTFKNKLTLLHRAWDVAVGGDDEDLALIDRPELRAVFEEPDLPARLVKLAAFNAMVMRRTAALQEFYFLLHPFHRELARLLDEVGVTLEFTVSPWWYGQTTREYVGVPQGDGYSDHHAARHPPG